MKNYIKITLFLAIFTSVISCDNQELQTNDTSSISNILKFDDFEEYDKALSDVNKMNEEELAIYEEANAYKSLVGSSERLYKETIWEDFESLYKIKDFVEDNKAYLTFVKGENDELELETVFHNRSDRYFLNDKKMYQIGDSLYKAGTNGTFVSSVKDFDLLLESTEDNLNNECSSKVKYIPSEKTLTPTTRAGGGMQGYFQYRSTSGKNRLKVTVCFQPDRKDYFTLECLARPYKRTWGAWFHCSRTMKLDVDIEARAYHNNGGYHYAKIDKTDGWRSTSKMYFKRDIPYPTTDYYKYGIHSMTIWADTKSVSPISESHYD